MINAKELWCDVDGVLLDWVQEFLKYLGKMHTGNPNQYKFEDCKDYAFKHIFASGDALGYHIKEFNKTPEYGNLPTLAKHEDLLILKSRGWKMNVITQIAESDDAVKEARLKNLERNFPGIFDEFEFTYPGQCKLDIIRAKRDGIIVIVEDAPRLLRKAHTMAQRQIEDNGCADVCCIGIRQPYNVEECNLKYIMGVDDFSVATQLLLAVTGDASVK